MSPRLFTRLWSSDRSLFTPSRCFSSCRSMQGQLFTEEEDAFILRERRAGKAYSVISKELDRKYTSVRHHYHKLDPDAASARATRRGFSDSENRLMVLCRKQGVKFEAIATELGRSKSSIILHYLRNGVALYSHIPKYSPDINALVKREFSARKNAA